MDYRSRQIAYLERELLRVIGQAPTQAIDLACLLGFTPAAHTLTPALRYLVGAGFLVKEGHDRRTTYRLASRPFGD